MLVGRQRAQPPTHFHDLLGVGGVWDLGPLGLDQPDPAIVIDQEIDFGAVRVAEVAVREYCWWRISWFSTKVSHSAPIIWERTNASGLSKPSRKHNSPVSRMYVLGALMSRLPSASAPP